MARFVITGTGTDVGKTVFAAGLSGLIGADYWKPVQSGLAGNIPNPGRTGHAPDVHSTSTACTQLTRRCAAPRPPARYRRRRGRTAFRRAGPPRGLAAARAAVAASRRRT